jgi:hypothetical protein
MEFNEGRIRIGNLDSGGGPIAVGGHIIDQRGRGAGVRTYRVTVSWTGTEDRYTVYAADTAAAAHAAGVMAGAPSDQPVIFTVVPEGSPHAE